jgi:hypothetical protein
MTLKTAAGYVTLWKKELSFESCHAPEKNGCMRAGTQLFPSEYQGEPLSDAYNVLTCVEHRWEWSAGLSVPCPPELPSPGGFI